MKIEASLSILFNNGIIELTIRDENAKIRFVHLSLTPDQFCNAALGRLMNTQCEADVHNLDRVGLNHENSTHEFEIPKDFRYDTKKKNIIDLAKKTCPDGWTADAYFGSQNSYFTKDGKDYARCTIRRWIK